MILVALLLVFVALFLLLIGFVFSTSAVASGLPEIGIACALLIVARLIQASEHHHALVKRLTKTEPPAS